MTRRERLERKLEKREEWAEGRDRKAAAGFEKARRIADHIPMGQPILVGHHSERPDRAILTALKAAGFSWGGGHWGGHLNSLPASVAELEGE